MSKQVIRTDTAPAPLGGAPYNQAIVAGGLVFVAGQLGVRPGDAGVEGTIGEQTEKVMQNIAAILTAAGSDISKLVKTTVFLADFDDFGGMNEVYARHAGPDFPARSTVEVARLPAGVLVEIEAVAAL